LTPRLRKASFSFIRRTSNQRNTLRN